MNTLDSISINPKDVPEHLKIGQENYENGKYDEAVIEFSSILNVAPGNMDARIWLKKAQESLDKEKGLLSEKVANPKIKELKDRPGSQRYCLYCVKGDVSNRVCSRLFQCKTCEFGQGMVDLQKAKLAAKKEAAVKE
jgi:hypothetical protein